MANESSVPWNNRLSRSIYFSERGAPIWMFADGLSFFSLGAILGIYPTQNGAMFPTMSDHRRVEGLKRTRMYGAAAMAAALGAAMESWYPVLIGGGVMIASTIAHSVTGRSAQKDLY